MSHFQHQDKSKGGCYTCTHWKGEFSGHRTALICRRDPDRISVTGLPESGCASWEREVGSDDEVPPAVARGEPI